MTGEILAQALARPMVPVADIAVMALLLAGPASHDTVGQPPSVCAGMRSLD